MKTEISNEDIEELQSKIHTILDEQAMEFNPNYSYAICEKYQGWCDNEIDEWVKKVQKR